MQSGYLRGLSIGYDAVCSGLSRSRRIGMRHAALLDQALMACTGEGSGLNMWSRRIEIVCGLLGGALGLAALGVWLFVPGCAAPFLRCLRGSEWQLQGLASLLFPITAVSGLALGIVLFALWHGLARSLPALVLLWVCTALLGVACVATVMTLPSIGVLIALQGGGGVLFVLLVLVPVLALLASIAGTVSARQLVPAHV